MTPSNLTKPHDGLRFEGEKGGLNIGCNQRAECLLCKLVADSVGPLNEFHPPGMNR